MRFSLTHCTVLTLATELLSYLTLGPSDPSTPAMAMQKGSALIAGFMTNVTAGRVGDLLRSREDRAKLSKDVTEISAEVIVDLIRECVNPDHQSKQEQVDALAKAVQAAHGPDLPQRSEPLSSQDAGADTGLTDEEDEPTDGEFVEILLRDGPGFLAERTLDPAGWTEFLEGLGTKLSWLNTDLSIIAEHLTSEYSTRLLERLRRSFVNGEGAFSDAVMHMLDSSLSKMSDVQAVSEETRDAVQAIERALDSGKLHDRLSKLRFGMARQSSAITGLQERFGRMQTSFQEFRDRAEVLAAEGVRATAAVGEQVQDLTEAVGKAVTQKAPSLADLRTRSYEQLDHALDPKSGTDLATKYQHRLYVQRSLDSDSNPTKTIDEILLGSLADGTAGSTGQNVVVIAGSTGAGKTSFLCHQALEMKARPSCQDIPILLSAQRLADTPLRLGLSEALLDWFGFRCTATDAVEVTELLIQHLKRAIGQDRQTKFVLFLDAINEVRPNAEGTEFRDFNRDLTRLLTRFAEARADGVPLAQRFSVVLTCRTEYWQYFSDKAAGAPWSEFVIGGSGEPTYVLGRFFERNLKEAIRRYFAAYGLSSVRPGPRIKELLEEPVMLLYFCEAYGSREVEERRDELDGDIDSLTRMDIFEAMVARYRQLLSKGIDDAEEVMSVTTRFLLKLAHDCYSHDRGMSFAAEDAQAVARELNNSDADLDPKDFATSNRSIFRRMVDHRLLLHYARDSREYRFVFDSYYEFCLGRYFAHEIWTKQSDGEVQESLDQIIKTDAARFHAPQKGATDQEEQSQGQHISSELAASMFYALLVVESDEEFSDRPLLFRTLIESLLGRDYAWKQQALAALRDSKLASPAVWERAKGSREQQTALRETLSYITAAVGRIVAKSDHVALWDVERTLVLLSEASDWARHHILGCIGTWLVSNQTVGGSEVIELSPIEARMRRIYAARALMSLRPLELSLDDDFQRTLQVFADDKALTQDFWVVRSLIAAAMESVDERGDSASSIDRTLYFTPLLGIVDQNAIHEDHEGFGDRTAIRGDCISALLLLSGGDEPSFAYLIEILAKETSSWVWWRVADSLRQWQASWGASIPARILAAAPQAGDEHTLSHALHRAQRHLEGIFPESAAIAELQLPRCPWGEVPNYPAGAFGSGVLGELIYHPIFLDPAYDNHPECRERLASILPALEGESMRWIQPQAASKSWLRDHKVHGPSIDRHRGDAPWTNYLDRMFESVDTSDSIQSGSRHRQLTGPMEMRPGITNVAQFSAGAMRLAATRALSPEGPRAAWAINRPPGHLANNLICVLNNAASGAAAGLDYMLTQLDGPESPRVLVIDLDVHHGQHTQQVFWRRKDVTYVSVHAKDSYSNEKGRINSIGEGEGIGWTFNLPFPTDIDDETFLVIGENFLRPIVLGLEPHLVVLSCGFDGLDSDPLTPQGRQTPASFGAMARTLRVAIDEVDAGREHKTAVIGTLEGGYSLTELGVAYRAVMREFGPQPSTEALVLERQVSETTLDDVRNCISSRLESCLAHGPELAKVARASKTQPGLRAKGIEVETQG